MKSVKQKISFLGLSVCLIMALPAQARIFQGKAEIDNGLLSGITDTNSGSIMCLVRYGGMRSVKKNYPNSPLDKEVRTFQEYLETGEAGQHGTAGLLPFHPESQFSGIIVTSGFEFIEKDFGLKFTVTAQDNTFIKLDGRDADGVLQLTVTDTVTGNLLSTSDFPVEMFFTGGYSIPQITVALPAQVIEKQKKDLTWDKDLLTQVRFQCN